MKVRSFRPEDVPSLFTLFGDTIRRVNSKDYSPEQVAAWAPNVLDPETKERWVTRFENSTTLMVKVKNDLAGYGNVEANGHIDHFYVSADHQRQGVGTVLMEELESSAREQGTDSLFAEVSVTAKPFFEKMGFKVEQEQHPVVNGVEFLNFAMRKPLSR